MSYPASLTTHTVKGRFVTHPDGKAAKGTVRFVLDRLMQGPTDDSIVAPFDIVVPLDSSGAFSVVLPATDDPQWTASEYKLTISTETRIKIGDRPESKIYRERIQIRHDEIGPIDLADLLNVPPVEPSESYVLQASKGAPGGVASLGLDGYLLESQIPPGMGGGEEEPVSWDDIEDKPSVFPHDEVTYAEVTGKPSTFPPSTHAHAFADVTGKPATYPPSTHAHAFADITGKPETYPHDPVGWDDVEDKPSTFPPSTHTHLWADTTDKPSTFPPSTHTHAYGSLTGIPSTFAPSAHAHAVGDVTGLQTELDAKADTDDVTSALATKADTSDLTSGLAGKANTTHSHAQTDISGLSASLAAKADAEAVTTSLASKADLVGGVIPTSQIPSISVIDFLGPVASESAMLALTGQKGDFALRTDLGQHWIITGTDPTELTSWTAVPLGSGGGGGAVDSVNGQVGVVVLGKDDIGLANVNNTADSAKPVSTAQQEALDLKAPIASPTFTGTVTGVSKSMVGLGNVDNTSDANKPVSTAQQAALDAKAPLASPTFTGTVAGVTKAMVGLGNVDNTADSAKPVSTAQQTALDAKAPIASPTFTGTVSGVSKSMVGLGNVDNTSDANKPVSTAQQTALDLKADASALAAKAPLASPTFTGTVSGITKSMVGLGNVDNTADSAKPVSTAQQTALDAKAPIASPTFTGTVGGITKAMVGLGNADNTSDANKPVSTAQQAALDDKADTDHTHAQADVTGLIDALAGKSDTGHTHSTSDISSLDTALASKAPIASPTFTGTVGGVTKSMVGLGNVDNTSDANKPVSTAQQTALDAKAPLASPALTGTPTAPTASGGTNTTQLATTAFVTSAVAGKANTSHTHASSDVTGLDTALAAKAPIASPTFTGTVGGITKSMVGLGNVDNTADSAKPVSTAQQTALDAKAPLASPALTGTPTAPTAAGGTNTTQLATTAFVTSGLSGKANSTHSHAQSDVTGLSTSLAAKADKRQDQLTINGGDVNGYVREVTIQDDNTATTGWIDRLLFKFADFTGGLIRNVFYLNEYGEPRVAPAKHNTTALRVFVKEYANNPATARSTTVPLIELMDNRTDRNSLWGVMSDGQQTRNNIRMADVLVLGAADTVPAGTPAGTVIIRTT